jgi:hypothetical protein
VIAAAGKPSITQAYNETLSSITTPYVVLSHNDAFPPVRLGRKVGQRILDHMTKHNLSLAGFCGSSKMIGARWQDAVNHLFGAVLNVPVPNGQPQPLSAVLWRRPARVITGMRALDGYCLVARTEDLKAHPFDTRYPSWHMYDVDIAATFYEAGLRTAVLADVSILHQSVVGYSDPQWAKEISLFTEKWRGKGDLVALGVGTGPSQVQSADPNLILQHLEHLEKDMLPICLGD